MWHGGGVVWKYEEFSVGDYILRGYVIKSVTFWNQLGMRNLYPRWVPRLLTLNNKRDDNFEGICGVVQPQPA